MTLRARRVAACLATALAGWGLAGVANAARGDDGGAGSVKPLVISGSVGGLLPGVPAVLHISVGNPNRVAVAVTSIVVVAHDAGAGCPASVLNFVPPPPGQVVAKRSTSLVPVMVTMAAGAPDACQGMTFELRHVVTARRAR